MRYLFADCELNTDRHSLSRGDSTVAVEPKVFDLVHLLASCADELVTRDRMIQEVWQGRIVSESAISACIAAARKAVGDDGKRQSVIRTVPRRGLQMAVTVTIDGPDPAATVPGVREVQRIRFCRTRKGHALAYAVTGSGPPVLRFGPPLTSDLELEWAYGMERSCISSLATRTRYLRFDHIGSGQSERAEPSLDFADEARDAAAAADAAGFERFAAASFSGGVHAAVNFAALYPERLTRLAIVGGYVEGRARRGPEREPDALRSMIAEGWAKPDSPFAAAFITSYFPEGPIEEARAVLRQMQGACDPDVMLKDRDAINSVSTLEILDRVRCPVLILHARDDAVHPLAQAQKLAANLPDAELVVMETANHVPLYGSGCWDSFNAILADFITG